MTAQHPQRSYLLRHSAIVLSVCIMLSASRVVAQGNPANPERLMVNAKGKITALAPGALQLQDAQGQTWMVQIDPRARELTFQGSAVAAFLRPGMFVDFRASCDQRGVAQEPVRQIKIFTPRENSQLGMIPANATKVGSLLGEEPKPQPGNRAAGPVFFQIVGKVGNISKNGEITVHAGNGIVRAKLDPKVQVAFEFSDLRMARIGDTAEVYGWSYPNQAGTVMANRLAVTATTPLGAVAEEGKKATKKKVDLDSLDDF